MSKTSPKVRLAIMFYREMVKHERAAERAQERLGKVVTGMTVAECDQYVKATE